MPVISLRRFHRPFLLSTLNTVPHFLFNHEERILRLEEYSWDVKLLNFYPLKTAPNLQWKLEVDML